VGGAHFDQPFKKGLTALCNAVAHGCADACERLVHYGARIDIVAPDESTLLHVAVRNGSVDCLRALLAARPALEPRDGADNTPLILAVKMEHLPSVALLLDAGADPRAESREGATPLRAAAARGCDQCLPAAAAGLPAPRRGLYRGRQRRRQHGEAPGRRARACAFAWTSSSPPTSTSTPRPGAATRRR
jgi:ankyrin repeat protein